MFREIFFYEIKRWLKLPLFYIYYLILFAFTFLLMAAALGAFDSISTTTDDGGTFANAPISILMTVNSMVSLAIFILPSIFGTSAYRDFQYNTHAMMFTTRITKPGFLLGRFFGSVVVAFLVFTSIGVAMLAATVMPFAAPELVGPFSATAYIQPYLIYILPNIIIYGALIFSMGLISRNNLATFVIVIVLFMLNNIAQSLSGNLEYETLGIFLDPSGSTAVMKHTQYWSVYEKNNLLVPLADNILMNRLLWIGAALVVFGATFYSFRFNQNAPVLNLFKRNTVDTTPPPDLALYNLPETAKDYSNARNFRLLGQLTRKEYMRIIKGPSFIVLLLVAMLFMFISTYFAGQMFGTSTYPVTWKVVAVGSGTFFIFGFFIILTYSGIIVNRERELKVNQLFDTFPVPNWVMFCSKLFALYLMCATLLLTVMINCIAIQSFNGYYNFELGVYIKSLFGFELIDYMLMVTLAMFVQVLVNNRYIGFFVLLAYYIFTMFQDNLGIEQPIFRYASDPGYSYSDMNGFGHFVFPYFLYKIYWAGLALALGLTAHLFWARGMETSFKWRLRYFRMRANRMNVSAIAASFVVLGTGLWTIREKSEVLDKYKPAKLAEIQRADYEKKYKRFEKAPQPRIMGVKVNVDIFPNENALSAKGQYTLYNKTHQPIDSVHISYMSESSWRSFSFNKKAELVSNDTVMGYLIYKFGEPLQPGDSMLFDFAMRYEPKGFENTVGVYYNGTFVNSMLFPSIGYNPGAELSEDRERKSYDLPPKPRMADVNDSIARKNTYISNDSDWITFEAVVSTVPEQIAIAPGYLQKEWTENNRRYFHYKMDSKILNFYSFLSAKYEIRRDKWKDVNIEIYYHKGHEYNIDRMVKAIKMSLDYYTENFSPYQHRQVRILEFPRYQMFAQSFPNTIPYSEAIGFIADVDDNNPEDVDYPFYVTAHEVAHQWWAHQVIGGNVQGSTILSETMSQYSALMVMEKAYGKEKMNRFLRHELKTYLTGRFVDRKERPIILVENQQHIHYNKGSLVMYALRDYIGEDSLNAALKRYIGQVAFQEPPYTNSLEFLSFIKAATPDSLKYLVHDMFEAITFYSNRAQSAGYTKLPDGKYKVSLVVESAKTQADSVGKEKALDYTDYIDIGVTGTDANGKDKQLYLQKHKIKKGKNTIEIIVSEEPKKAGIDIYNKLIDKIPEDNSIAVLPSAGDKPKELSMRK